MTVPAEEHAKTNADSCERFSMRAQSPSGGVGGVVQPFASALDDFAGSEVVERTRCRSRSGGCWCTGIT